MKKPLYRGLLLVLTLLSISLSELSAIQADSAFIQKLPELVKDQKGYSVLYIPIGPSGSGKSTLYQKIASAHPEIASFSFDSLRHEWYDPIDYDAAWKASAADPTFYSRAEAVLKDQINASKSIYFDATNLNPSKRANYIKMAKEQGYTIAGLVFSVKLETLIERQSTRSDKSIAEEVVKTQFAACMPPQIGEGFDVVFFLDNP